MRWAIASRKYRSWVTRTIAPAEVVGQVLLEPLGGVGVEVVGRLVEDGDVGARDEELRERDAPPLAAAALAARAVDVAHAELVEEAERLVPALPPAEAHDGVVELGLLVRRARRDASPAGELRA